MSTLDRLAAALERAYITARQGNIGPTYPALAEALEVALKAEGFDLGEEEAASVAPPPVVSVPASAWHGSADAFPATSFPANPASVSLGYARTWLATRVRAGEVCPCCTQFAKIYARTITSTMAYALILIYRHAVNGGEEWLHVPDYLSRVCKVGPTVRGGDWAKLTAWGLIEEEDGVREDGSGRTGYYRITEAGKAFVRGETSLPGHAEIFSGRVLRLDDSEKITIGSALGKRFDYQELMRAEVGGL